MVQRQTRAVSREVSARKGQTRRRPITMVSTSTAITYPHPQRPRRSALAESGQHGGVDPNFPAYSGRTQRHPIRTTRFRSSQACDPKLWGSPKRHRFDTPTRYIMRASEPRFRSSEALSGTWWQVKDSNLRSFRDGFTDHQPETRDQPERLNHKQLTGVFQADSRRQPTSAVANRTPPRPQELLSRSASVSVCATPSQRVRRRSATRKC